MNPSRIYQSFKNGHSRSSGNVLIKPLDSGLRRNDGGVAKIKVIRLPACVYHFVVIPAKARLQDVGGRAASGTSRRGIQEGDDGVPQESPIQLEIP